MLSIFYLLVCGDKPTVEYALVGHLHNFFYFKHKRLFFSTVLIEFLRNEAAVIYNSESGGELALVVF